MTRTLHALALATLALCVLLIAGSALAQDAAPAAGFVDGVLMPALFAFLAVAVPFVTTQATVLLRRASAAQKSKLMEWAVNLVGTLAVRAVGDVAQRAVLTLKAAHEDGKLSREEATAAMRTATQQVWTALGAEARAVLVASVGSEKDVREQIIQPAIEANVALLDSALPEVPPLASEIERLRALTEARRQLGLDPLG
jgi:hypothetical protein